MWRVARPLGYDVDRQANSTGQTLYRLSVNMTSPPSEVHYDPDEMWLQAGKPGEGVDRVSVRHPLLRDVDYCACPGRVTLSDRRGKRVVFFTYGGDFKAEACGTRTAAALISPAPIIEISRGPDLWSMLADKSEVLLARRRAAYGHDQSTLEENLCCVDPFVLYAAVLTTLLERYERIAHVLPGTQALRFRGFLQSQHRRSRREPRWPHRVPAVEDLL